MPLPTWEVFNELSDSLPNLSGVSSLTQPLKRYAYLINRSAIGFSHHTTLVGAVIAEFKDPSKTEGVTVYFIIELNSFYRNENYSNNLKKTKRTIYIVQQHPNFARDNQVGAWEISKEGILELLANIHLGYIRRCATISEIIQKHGEDSLTRSNQWRWDAVCHFTNQDPLKPEEARLGILAKCSEWEEAAVTFRNEVEELVKKEKTRRRGGSPEINSDFRRFHN